MQAMQHLTSLGHRRIGFITGRLDLVSANRRLQGYRDGLAVAGIPLDNDLIQVGDYLTESAIQLTHNLLTLDDPPTAIFASNDMSAIGVYRAAQEVGFTLADGIAYIDAALRAGLDVDRFAPRISFVFGAMTDVLE